MKSFVILLVCAMATALAQEPQNGDELMAQMRATLGINIYSTEELRTAPPRNAWRFFMGLTGSGDMEAGRELTKQAGKAIAENEAVAEYVKSELARIPNDFNTSGERGQLLLPLGSVPAPWSLKLLGQYLTDPTPMKPGAPGLDYSATPNRILALNALERMGFSDSPTRGWDTILEVGDKEAWMAWWEANKDRVEQRIQEINPGYDRPTPVPASPKSSPAMAGPVPSPATPKPSATPLPVAEVTRRHDWLLYIAGGVVALGAIGAVVWAFRPRR